MSTERAQDFGEFVMGLPWRTAEGVLKAVRKAHFCHERLIRAENRAERIMSLVSERQTGFGSDDGTTSLMRVTRELVRWRSRRDGYTEAIALIIGVPEFDVWNFVANWDEDLINRLEVRLTQNHPAIHARVGEPQPAGRRRTVAGRTTPTA